MLARHPIAAKARRSALMELQETRREQQDDELEAALPEGAPAARRGVGLAAATAPVTRRPVLRPPARASHTLVFVPAIAS